MKFSEHLNKTCEDCGCAYENCECIQEDIKENYTENKSLYTTSDTLKLLQEVKTLNSDIYCNKEQIQRRIDILLSIYDEDFNK